MLKNTEHTRRCAAALVLTELAPKSVEVVKALGEALPAANEQLAGYILGALQAIGSPAAVPYVMPLLNSRDMTVKMRAVGIVASGGDAVLPEVKRQLKDANREQKLVLIDLLARIHTGETLETLLDLLFDSDFTLVKETCDAVRRHAASAQPPERLTLHKQVVKFMKNAEVQKQERVLTSALLLLGHIGRPEAAAILLKHSTPKMLPYIRRHALIALKGVQFADKTAATVLNAIFPYLDDPDEETVKHTLDIMARLPTACITPAKWRNLLKNKHPYARAFAVRVLAATDTTENNILLVELLLHEDDQVREIAAAALTAHKKSVPVLVKALAAEEDREAAWTLARILKPHYKEIDNKTLKKFITLATKELLAGKPRHEPLLHFVRNCDVKAAETILLDAGIEHQRAKRWSQAVECLRRLLHTQTFNDEVSYTLSACNLKVSHKELAPQYRAGDHALRGLALLLRHNNADLLSHLKKDKTLDAADLYYVGFHFSEGSTDEQTFAAELLKHVVKTWPKSPEAKAIRERNKA